jgi:hypothetical protein
MLDRLLGTGRRGAASLQPEEMGCLLLTDDYRVLTVLLYDLRLAVGSVDLRHVVGLMVNEHDEGHDQDRGDAEGQKPLQPNRQ